MAISSITWTGKIEPIKGRSGLYKMNIAGNTTGDATGGAIQATRDLGPAGMNFLSPGDELTFLRGSFWTTDIAAVQGWSIATQRAYWSHLDDKSTEVSVNLAYGTTTKTWSSYGRSIYQPVTPIFLGEAQAAVVTIGVESELNTDAKVYKWIAEFLLQRKPR